MLDDNNPDTQDIELISKSQLKRESHDIQHFGKQLVALKDSQLDSLELPESLFHAVKEAQKILNKRSALKRQYQYIGKLLRKVDFEPIQERYLRIENQAEINNKIQQQAEYWRDQIILNGIDSINVFLQTDGVNCDRQQLRQLARNAQTAKKEAQKKSASRNIYRLIYDTLKTQEEDSTL